jgi:hypothetical protein
MTVIAPTLGMRAGGTLGPHNLRQQGPAGRREPDGLFPGSRVTERRLHHEVSFAYLQRMQDKPAYYKQAGRCTRCWEPFRGNRATAFMVRERVVWQVLGNNDLGPVLS